MVEARLERGGDVGVERAGVGEGEDEPFAGDTEPARGAVEAEQDDLLGKRFQLRRNGRNRPRCAWVGGRARHVAAAAGGDLDAEDGGHETNYLPRINDPN